MFELLLRHDNSWTDKALIDAIRGIGDGIDAGASLVEGLSARRRRVRKKLRVFYERLGHIFRGEIFVHVNWDRQFNYYKVNKLSEW